MEAGGNALAIKLEKKGPRWNWNVLEKIKSIGLGDLIGCEG